MLVNLWKYLLQMTSNRNLDFKASSLLDLKCALVQVSRMTKFVCWRYYTSCWEFFRGNIFESSLFVVALLLVCQIGVHSFDLWSMCRFITRHLLFGPQYMSHESEPKASYFVFYDDTDWLLV